MKLRAILVLLAFTGCQAAHQPVAKSTATATPTPTVFTTSKIGVNFLEPGPRTTFHYRSRDENAVVTYRNLGALSSDTGTNLRVSVRGVTAYDRTFTGLSPLQLHFVGVNGLSRPLIDLQLYSGGAHCCFSDVYVEAEPSAADTYSALRDWGSYPGEWKRVGRDRHYAIVAMNGTSYEFGGYAGSTGPIMVYDWRNHGLAEDTVKYADLLEQDARGHIAEYNLEAQHGTAGEAALVSYLADEYRLGRPDTAWQRVEQLYQGRAGDTADFTTHAKAWLEHQHLDVTPVPSPTTPKSP